MEANGQQEAPLYEYTAHFTKVVEYGTSAEALFSGQAAPPPEGARLDVYFEGPVTGTKLRGHMTAVDYIQIRADGRVELNIRAEITTDDGKKIALHTDGVGIPQNGSPVFLLRENATLTTNHPEYAWLNPLQIWAPGTVDVSKGEIQVKAYAS